VLFDLQSPGRRRFIKVIYAGLALLMGGGLILFGIGSSGSGGLLDALGIGNGNGGGSASSAFASQVSAAEKKAQLTPKNPDAQLALARIYVQAGNAAQNVGQNNQPLPSSETIQDYSKAADAWDAYLKLKPRKINPTGATLISQAYFALAQTSTTAGDALINIQQAAKAQKIVAAASPSLGSLSTLAFYLYFAGDTAAADQAVKQAEAKAQPSQKTALVAQAKQIKAAAAKFQAQVAAANRAAKRSQTPGASGAPGGASPFSNPLGSNGGLSGGP